MSATDATRAVYQRKLRRWLLYGLTAETSTSQSTQVEPHVCVALRSKMATVDEESSVLSFCSKKVEDGPGSKPTATACDAKLKNPDKVSMNVMPAVVHPKCDFSPVRMSKSEIMPQVRPYSMTFAECGSELFSETDNGWFDMDRLRKPKANSIATDEPVVTSS